MYSTTCGRIRGGAQHKGNSFSTDVLQQVHYAKKPPNSSSICSLKWCDKVDHWRNFLYRKDRYPQLQPYRKNNKKKSRSTICNFYQTSWRFPHSHKRTIWLPCEDERLQSGWWLAGCSAQKPHKHREKVDEVVQNLSLELTQTRQLHTTEPICAAIVAAPERGLQHCSQARWGHWKFELDQAPDLNHWGKIRQPQIPPCSVF